VGEVQYGAIRHLLSVLLLSGRRETSNRFIFSPISWVSLLESCAVFGLRLLFFIFSFLHHHWMSLGS
jgi:hypothetical protein